MNDRAARIAAMLGIVPFAFGFSTILTDCLPDDHSPFKAFEQAITAVALVISLIAVVCLWRHFIPYRPRRLLMISAGLVLVAVHTAIFPPLWSMGCFPDENDLAAMQSFALYGLWRFISPLLLWGAFIFIRRSPIARIGGLRPMTSTAVRLVVGMAMIPLMPSLWGITYSFFSSSMSFADADAVALALLLISVLVVTVWILLWRPVVNWTRQVVVLTLVFACLFVATFLAPFMPDTQKSINTIVSTSPFWMWGLWMFGTAWLWRSPGRAVDDESNAAGRLCCPQCAYSLRGLSEARCPECGWTGTLDALFARAMEPEV